MNVTFYTVSKRRNSTKQPSGTGASYTCLLKEDTTTSRPQIAIKWDGTSGSPAAYNYAYISAFGRYYWVNSWAYVDRQWIASCSVDVLATYKTEIGSSSKYVLRAASDYDPEVIDTLYTPKLKKHIASATQSGGGFSWASTLAGGTIIVGIVGMNDSVAYSSGGISYYAVTPADYMQFMSDMYTGSYNLINNETYGTDVGDAIKALSKNLLRSVTNPTQYIKSAMWFPFSFSTAGGVNPVVGGITSAAVFYPLSNPIKSETVDFSVSTQMNSTTDIWQNMTPFARFTAYIPPYGTFDLDTRKLYGASAVRCFVKTDAISGLSHIIISSVTTGQTNNPTFAQTVSQVGVPMDFSGLKTSNTAISSIIGATAGVMSGDVLGAAAGIANLIDSAIPVTESRSTYGGISGDTADKYIECIWYDVPELDVAERGKPLCKTKTINTLSGYVLCADGEIVCNATEEEHRELEAFMTGGFFYE